MQRWFVRYGNGTGSGHMPKHEAEALARKTGGELCFMRDRKRPHK